MGERITAREYLRVSLDRDGEGTSPRQQHEENLAAVERRDWRLHPEPYEDPGISASRYSKRRRKGFEALLVDLESGDFGADVLVLWESSRGSRRVSEWVTLIEICEEAGVSFLVTTHGRTYDPANPRDRRSLLEDAVDSEYESAKTSERIRRHVRAHAKNGGIHGKNMYGYRRVYERLPSGRQRAVAIEKHPEQAPVVEEAARRFLAGDSMYSIAKDFNRRGIPPRRKAFKGHRQKLGWTMEAISQMLRMQSYAGRRVHTDTATGEVSVYKANWPALIEPEAFDEIQAKMAQARRGDRDWTAVHLLSGIATCGECGALMRVGKQNAGSRKDRKTGEKLPRPEEGWPFYLTYICQGAPGRTGFHVAMKMDHLDQVVTELVLAKVSQPDFLAEVGQRGTGVDDQRKALIDLIASKRAYLDEVAELAAQTRDAAMLAGQRAIVLPEIEAAQKELESLAGTDPTVTTLAGADDVVGAWDAMELGAKRRVIKALLTPVVARSKRPPGSKGIDLERVTPVWH